MKTDLELNATADYLFTELAKHHDPQEAITVLGVTLLIIYERATWQPRPPIETFANDVREGLIRTWKLRSAPAPTTMTKQ